MTQDQIATLHWHANEHEHTRARTCMKRIDAKNVAPPPPPAPPSNANEKVTVQSWHARKNQLASQYQCVRQRQLAIECQQANKGQLAVQK